MRSAESASVFEMMNRRNQTIAADVERGWRRRTPHVSLPEVHRSIVVPTTASFWRKLIAFSGPGFLVAVGYMDPGNWATDLSGGAKFGYALLTVVMISNFMAILLQHLCIKLGVATGRDLAQACRDHYSTLTVWSLWILCEIAIAACDLAEVVGSAIGLQLLFGIPLVWGCIITALDVLAVLYLQTKGFRYIETLVITLIATIGSCFAAELIFSNPVLTAAVFHWSGHQDVAEIQNAYKLLSPLLGVGIASVLFAVALLASGQNSTLTGTLAGQIVMEGFLNFRITPWLRRLITRALAIIPAVLIIGIFGEGKTTQLLVASQVVLSMQLGFAVWPLMRFTNEKTKMGEFANRLWLKILGWTVAGIIIVLNVKLLFDTFMPAAILKAIYRLLGLPAPMQ